MVKAMQRPAEATAESTRRGSVRPLRPWVEAGWIFKDGEIVVIERHGDETRARKVESVNA
jgi:hypothetical protein